MWNTVMVEFQQEACLDLNRIYSTGSQQLNGLIMLFFDLGYSFLSNIISEWSNKNVFSKFQCRAFLSAYIRVTESHKLKVCLFVCLRRSAFANRLTGELNNPPPPPSFTLLLILRTLLSWDVNSSQHFPSHSSFLFAVRSQSFVSPLGHWWESSTDYWLTTSPSRPVRCPRMPLTWLSYMCETSWSDQWSA